MAFQDHFSGHAAGYSEARPTYPPELFAWLAAQCPRRTLVWDAGCGNGQASVALAAHFDAVVATDPSPAQIANALAHPRVRYAVEAAEACSLAAGSVDLVTVAQAYHWFDHAAFCAQAERVLVPDGLAAVWTYARSRVSREVDAVFDQLHDSLLADDWPPGREHVLDGYRQLPFPFERVPPPHFEIRRQWTLENYLAYLESWSASQRYRRRTGTAATQKIAAAMAAAWGDRGQTRTISWPLTVIVGRR